MTFTLVWTKKDADASLRNGCHLGTLIHLGKLPFTCTFISIEWPLSSQGLSHEFSHNIAISPKLTFRTTGRCSTQIMRL